MSTIRVKGQEVRVGDDLWFLGKPHRVTRIEDYFHPAAVPAGETWRIVYSDGPGTRGKAAWGLTLEYQHGCAASYEISERALPLTWLALAAIIVVACAILAITVAVIVGYLGGIPRPDLRRRKRTGRDGNSGE